MGGHGWPQGAPRQGDPQWELGGKGCVVWGVNGQCRWERCIAELKL